MGAYKPQHHHHRSIRLKGCDYSQSGAYFVTICTYQHKPLFGAVVGGEMVFNSVGQVVWEQCFKSARIRPEIELFTDEFVAMPNGIIWIVYDPSVWAATRRVAPTLSSQPWGPRYGSTGEDKGNKNNRPGFSTMLWIMGGFVLGEMT